MSVYSFYRELGISHADFRRVFPRVVAPAKVTWQGSVAIVDLGPGTVTVTLGDEKCRQLGLIKIPYTELHFDIQGLDAKSIEVFMHNFMASFQKGGG
ncbi:MAG: hypothetical protein AAF384_09175 [Pseudomonadota bacterium]